MLRQGTRLRSKVRIVQDVAEPPIDNSDKNATQSVMSWIRASTYCLTDRVKGLGNEGHKFSLEIHFVSQKDFPYSRLIK